MRAPANPGWESPREKSFAFGFLTLKRGWSAIEVVLFLGKQVNCFFLKFVLESRG